MRSSAALEVLCSTPQRCTSRRPSRIFVLPVQLALLLITISSLCHTASASSASATASAAASQYESVRALDQYGNAVQLENARAAADQQGRLVIGIRRKGRRQNSSTSFWILSTSLSRTQSPHLRVTARASVPEGDGSSGDAAGTSSTGIVHWLWSPPPAYDPSSASNSGSGSSSTTSCMVCTGVQADAVWLVGQMQSYQKNRWERYNNNRANSLATAVSDCMRLFWGHNSQNMWHGASWKSVMDTNGNNNDDSWARPLGVRALVLQGSEWYLVEPSGVVSPCDRVCCMGPNSPLIQTKLFEAFDKREQEEREKRLLNGADGDDVDLDDDAEGALLQELVTGVLTSVLGTKPETVLLEVVSARGVERRTIAL
jgi:hypothetical protein